MCQNMAENRKRDSQKMRNITKVSKDLTETSPLLQTSDESSSQNSDTVNSVGGCRASCARRPLPQGKGLLLLLFVYFVESFAFYCATKSIRELLFKDETNQALGSFLFSLVYNTLGRLFYPFAGVLADTFWGRYKVIKFGLWLIAFALGFICINLSIIDGVTEPVGQIFLPIICILLVAIGSACVEVNAISFGVDQLPQGCTSDQISSYFLWYYFARNASSLLGVIAFLMLQVVPLFFPFEKDYYYYKGLKVLMKSVDIHYKTLIVILIAASAIVCSLLLHIFKHNWYFKNSQRENPVKTIINVSWYSLTVKRHLPVYRRTFRYGEARQPRIELAKKEFDGIFDAEEVENVKSFYQILFLILSLGGFLICNGGALSILPYQFEDITEELSKSYYSIAFYLNDLVNTVTIVIFIPLFNHVALPFLPLLSMSLKFRMIIGLVLNLIATLTAVFIEITVEIDRNDSGNEKLIWLLLPAIVFSVAETLTIVSCLEFIYAQAPEPMKGLLTGLFYFMFGVFGGISNIVFYYFPFSRQKVDKINYILWFYVLLTIVAALGFLMYVIVMWFYRNRRRPAVDEEDLTNRLYAQNVYFPQNVSTVVK